MSCGPELSFTFFEATRGVSVQKFFGYIFVFFVLCSFRGCFPFSYGFQVDYEISLKGMCAGKRDAFWKP